MQKYNMTKADLARRMGTSRAALERLLDENNLAVTLGTMGRAAAAIGKQMQIKFVNA